MPGQVELSQIIAEVAATPEGRLELAQLLAEVAAQPPEGTIYLHGVQLSEGDIAAIRMHGDMTEFLSLLDTPDSYAGQSGKVAAVKATEDGLELVDQETNIALIIALGS